MMSVRVVSAKLSVAASALGVGIALMVIVALTVGVAVTTASSGRVPLVTATGLLVGDPVQGR